VLIGAVVATRPGGVNAAILLLSTPRAVVVASQGQIGTVRRPQVKHLLLALTLCAALGLSVSPAVAHDAYDDSESHPLRLAAYALNPVGFALEWLVMRPIHFFVSDPQLEPIFGHVPHESPYGDYKPYVNEVVPE
jgi:hypothetical protein